jgi:hypothetical protein
MPKNLPSIEYLHKALRYNPSMGFFTWRERTSDMFRSNASKSAAEKCAIWNSKKANTPAFTSAYASGYNTEILDGVGCMASHVAWAMTHRVWPRDDGRRLCFKNHIRHDNRIENLELRSPS